MSAQLHDDDVVARLRAGDPGYPDTAPDAGRTLAAARRALRRRRAGQALGGVAAVVAAVVGLTAVGLPTGGTTAGGARHDPSSPSSPGGPPVFPREKLLQDIAGLQQVLPVTEDLGLTRYIDDGPPGGRPVCRVLTWSHGAFRDRDHGCANPDDPELSFDAESDAAFSRMSEAIERAGVGVNRIEKGGWGPGTSFHLRDDSWTWNWYYSYVPGTPTGAQEQIRTNTRLGVRLQIHVSGDWWFTAEPDD